MERRDQSSESSSVGRCEMIGGRSASSMHVLLTSAPMRTTARILWLYHFLV